MLTERFAPRAVFGVGYDPLREARHPGARAAREQADWLLWLELGGLSPRTVADYEKATSVALRLFPTTAFSEFTDGDLIHVAKQFPPAGRRSRMAAYANWFDWGYRTRRINENPYLRLPRMKRGKQRYIETFSDGEIERFYSLPVIDASLMVILIEAGIRKAEARNMRVSDFKPDAYTDAPFGRLVVLGGKGDKDRVIPATRRLKEAIEELKLFEGLARSDFFWYTRNAGATYSHVKRERPMGESSFVKWWAAVTDAAGVEYIPRNPKKGVAGRGNPHTTRHTFATRWLRRGGRLETLSMVMGHSSIRTTFDLYGHLDTRDVARDLAAIQAFDEAGE